MNAPHRRRTRWVQPALLIGGLALLAWTLYRQRDTLVQVTQAAWDWRLIGLAVGCLLLCELGVALRWYTLVRAVVPVPWGAVWRLGLMGMVFNAVTPGANGGDLVKAGVVLTSRLPRTLVLSSLALDRVIGLLGLLLLASVAAGVSWPSAPVVLRPLLAVIWSATAIAALGFLMLFHPGTARAIIRLGAWLPPLRSILEQLASGTAAYRAVWPRMVLAVSLALGSNSLTIMAFYLVDRMLFPSAQPALWQHFVLVPMVLVVAALPLPGGAIGVTEEVSQQLFRLADHPGGALAMLGYRAAQMGAIVVGSLIYATQWHKLQELLGPTSVTGPRIPAAVPKDPVAQADARHH